jgi:hypothetical protein
MPVLDLKVSKGSRPQNAIPVKITDINVDEYALQHCY